MINKKSKMSGKYIYMPKINFVDLKIHKATVYIFIDIYVKNKNMDGKCTLQGRKGGEKDQGKLKECLQPYV